MQYFACEIPGGGFVVKPKQNLGARKQPHKNTMIFPTIILLVFYLFDMTNFLFCDWISDSSDCTNPVLLKPMFC